MDPIARPDAAPADHAPTGVPSALSPTLARTGFRRRTLFPAGLSLPGALLACLAALIYYSAGPSLACLAPAGGPARPGLSSRVLISGGARRCYLLYAPAGLDPARPLPAVFALHGFAGHANSMRSIAVWEPLAEREDFLVVYPDGSSFLLRWNIGPVANIPTVDDVQFIGDVIADLSHIAPLDPARIYVTGFSNGGQMAHRIACQLAHQVAGVGIVDGFDAGMLAGDCLPSRPVPVMAFFGDANPLAGADYPEWFQKLVNVRIEPGPPLPANAVELWLEAWAVRNGCSLPAEPMAPSGNAGGVRYTGCRDGAEVVLYRIAGQGHAWPGGPALPFLGESVSDINSGLPRGAGSAAARETAHATRPLTDHRPDRAAGRAGLVGQANPGRRGRGGHAASGSAEDEEERCASPGDRARAGIGGAALRRRRGETRMRRPETLCPG